MKVCFAVQKDDGVESVVYGHFGSAPAFIVVDTEAADAAVTVNNRDLNHVHGACNPIQAIGGLKPDAVVVGGIGAQLRINLKPPVSAKESVIGARPSFTMMSVICSPIIGAACPLF